MVLEEVGTEESNTEPSSEPSTEPSSEPSNESILPFAEAGLDQSVFLDDTIILDGSASIGEQFIWTQSYGDSLTLDDSNQQVASFVAEKSGLQT